MRDRFSSSNRSVDRVLILGEHRSPPLRAIKKYIPRLLLRMWPLGIYAHWLTERGVGSIPYRHGDRDLVQGLTSSTLSRTTRATLPERPARPPGGSAISGACVAPLAEGQDAFGSAFSERRPDPPSLGLLHECGSRVRRTRDFAFSPSRCTPTVAHRRPW
jgi:hypothetical protein